jgi:hypothetical protein
MTIASVLIATPWFDQLIIRRSLRALFCITSIEKEKTLENGRSVHQIRDILPEINLDCCKKSPYCESSQILAFNLRRAVKVGIYKRIFQESHFG